MAYENLIKRLSEEGEGFDPDLAHSVMNAESSGRRKAVSKMGAKGLFQLMPLTAKSLGVTDPFDPEQSIRGGMAYLRKIQRNYPNRPDLALAAYNMGPTALRDHIANYGDDMSKWPKDKYVETLKYVPKIASDYEIRTGRPFMVAEAETGRATDASVRGVVSGEEPSDRAAADVAPFKGKQSLCHNGPFVPQTPSESLAELSET